MIMTTDSALKLLAEAASIPIEELTGTSQVQYITYQRHMAMFFMSQELGIPHTKIMRAFGKGHSAVCYAVRKFERELEANRAAQLRYAEMKDQFYLRDLRMRAEAYGYHLVPITK